MPICKLCNNKFPSAKKIDGKKRNLGNRKYCLDCSPFNFHNTKSLENKITKKPNGQRPKSENDGKKLICKCCGRDYIYFRARGHTLKICNSCSVYVSRGRLKEKAVEYKGGKCERCGYNKCIASLCFHHIDPSNKDFEISRSHFFKFDKIKEELDKCELLCSNCHNEIHFSNEKRHYFIQEKKDKKINKCKKCNVLISRNASICLKCHNNNQKTKIEWPSTDDLIDMLKKSSYVKVAKMLGVSDNAIRKRIKNHKQ